MKKILLLIALLALSAAAWGQSDRVKTVETPDSASMVIFDTTGTNILGTDVQEAIEESNPLYPNHVWISETGGNNATGVLGDPHRAFADPWGAQNGILENTLSYTFLQGVYNYGGPYSNPAVLNQSLAKKDTTYFSQMGRAEINLSNLTGSRYPFLSDAVSDFATSLPRKVYFDMPDCEITLGNNATTPSIPFGFYDIETEVNVNVKKIKSGTSANRAWGMQSGARRTVAKIGEIDATGGVAFSFYHATNSGGVVTSAVSRYWDIEIGKTQVDFTTDINGIFRIQNSNTPDSASTLLLKVGSVFSSVAGSLLSLEFPAASKLNYIHYNIENVDIVGTSVPSNGYVTGTANQRASNYYKFPKNGSISIVEGLDWKYRSGPVFGNFTDAGAVNADSSTLYIKLGRVVVDTGAFIILNNLNLRNGSKVIIECDYCETTGGAFAWVFGNTVDATSEIIFRGTFVTGIAGGAVINTRNPITLEGVFLNDGASAWLVSDSGTPTVTVNGAWSNSSVTTGVVISGNELWGFSDCSGTFRPLQEILDAGCDTASSAELTIFFTDTPPDTIELTTSYTVVEWQAGGTDGPAIALSSTGDSLLLDEGIYEIHYNIQAIFFAATTDYYIQPAIRQGAGVLNKSIRTAYNIWGADEEKATHIACTFRTEISADDTPIALVLAGDDNAAGGADVLIEKAILYVEKIE